MLDSVTDVFVADEKINISYRFQRPDYRGVYSKGPYFMELDCLSFKKPD